jgi:hypothetical protein
MKLPRDIASMSREELLVLVAQLERQVAQLSASLEVLQTENAQLQLRNQRQGAPFSKGARGSQPKRPSRKPGEGTFSSGKEAASRPPPPLRTGYESFPSSGSSRWAFMLPSSVGCVSGSGRLRGAIAGSLPRRPRLP